MLTNQEFEAILADQTKRIEGDIRWLNDEDKSGAVEFRVDIWSEADWPLRVKGWLNPQSGKLSYSVLHRGQGRIIGLDMGEGLVHHNPGCRRRRDRQSCECPRGTHKQYWTAEDQMLRAFVPGDISEPWERPVEVWREFCGEVRLVHVGRMWIPEWQEELL